MTHFNTDNTDGYSPEQLRAANAAMTAWCSEHGDPRGSGNDDNAYKTECERALLGVEDAMIVTWKCDDGNGQADEVEAATAREAAEAYAADGDWDRIESTMWITVSVWPSGQGDEDAQAESITVSVDPQEPACSEAAHDWQSPHDIVGGLKENPGVQGHGGGVTIHEVCSHCGRSRWTDTWATDPDTGEQGLRSVSYEEPDLSDDDEDEDEDDGDDEATSW